MPFRNQAIAALTLLVMVASVAIGGHALLRQQAAVVEVEAIAPETAEPIPVEPSTTAIPEKKAEQAPLWSRPIKPETVAPPQIGLEELERIDPRAPLGELALAKPPAPAIADSPDGSDGTTLFQPVAPAAGVIEAMGRSVTVTGIDAVALDETCTDDQERQWACGLHARGAFRAFLRGRAPVCTMPPEGDAKSVIAPCSLGKQDIGAWLVSNGWARPAEGGPYAEAGEKAKTARKGIFGAAPDLSGLPPEPAPVEAPVEAPSSILDMSGEPATSATGQPAPFQ